MNTNLNKYSNNDWTLWVKLVKKTYKSQGINLTQQQALIVSKDSYPGKGNVIGKDEKKLKIPFNENIPENPVRRKKEPPPKKEAKIYTRENEYRERGKKNEYREMEKKKLPKREKYYESSESESEESPPPKRKTNRYVKKSTEHRKYIESDSDTPPRRNKREEEIPPRRRRKESDKYDSPQKRKYRNNK